MDKVLLHALTRLSHAMRGTLPGASVWISLAAMIAVARGAVAATGATGPTTQKTPILVVEAHTGERPSEVAPVIDMLNDALEKRGFAAHASTILHITTGLPRPGILDKEVTAAQIAQNVDNGYDLFTKGRKDAYRQAIVILTRTVEMIQRNPALIVLNTSNSDVVQKAYITLALCQAYLGNADWTLTMMQEIRMFPTRPFPRADYGPNDESFYKKVYRQVQTLGRGKLLVSAGNSHAVVFVEGQIRGIDKVELADLIPGTYHVFVQVPGTPGHQYEIDVVGNDETVLNADSEGDCSLLASDSWVGFLFATSTARGKEGKCAARIAARWSSRDLVAVVGTLRLSGRLVLIGTIYATDGTMLRSMQLDVQRAKAAHLEQLARLMAEGGVPTDGIILVGQGTIAPEAPEEAPTRPSWWQRPTPYLIGGTAVVLASVGLYVGAPKDDGSKPTYTDYRSPAVLTFVGGSVVVGGGVYLWLRQERSASVFTSAAIGGGVAATLSGVILYATDEDLHDQEFQRPTYRDSAGVGVALGAAGVAATSVGLFFLWRDHPSPIVPTAVVDSHRGLLSVSGRF